MEKKIGRREGDEREEKDKISRITKEKEVKRWREKEDSLVRMTGSKENGEEKREEKMREEEGDQTKNSIYGEMWKKRQEFHGKRRSGKKRD